MSSIASQATAVQSAMLLLEDAGAKIEKAIALLRDSGQTALAGQLDALLVDSGTAPAVADADDAAARETRRNDAYLRLLPKLLVLAHTIDGMTEAKWRAWLNQLPQDEFFECLAVASTELSLKAAVAEAREIASSELRGE